jgi:transposase InsO family protein
VSHPNAPLTVVGRRLLCSRITELGWTVTDAAAAAGISRQTAHKWLRRFLRCGEAGLCDRSSRPTRVRERVSAADVARIWRRRRQREGPLAISWNTGIPRSTVYAVLARNGQGRLVDLDREPKAPVVRYEHAAPGDLIHIDVKKLGRLGEGGGWRFGGRVAKKRARGIGCDFVHVAIDDHSRLAYVEVHDDERADTVAEFTRKAIEHYASHGIEVKRLLTDNAMSYYSHAQLAVLEEHGVKRSHTRPYRPQTNGKAERFIRLLINGWAYAKPYDNNRERLSALPRWIFNYNHRRPHGGIGGLPPISRVPGVNNLCGQYI